MFCSTQEAVKFGLQASGEERKMLLGLRTMFLRDFDLAMDREAFDQASIFATKAQFCREALEAKTIIVDHRELFKDFV